MAVRSWTDEQLKEVLPECTNLSQVTQALGLATAGGNYLTITKRIATLGLDTTHFEWSNKNPEGSRNRYRTDQILTVNSPFTNSSDLKQRLFKEGLLQNVCSECGQPPEWNGKSLTLQLDHINGVRTDNRLENLRILCGHCHSQTDTFCGRNVKRTSKREVVVKTRPKKEKKYCVDCGGESTGKSRCAGCYAVSQERITWPPTEELTQMVRDSSYVAVSKVLGVSGNAVKKRIKNHGSKG